MRGASIAGALLLIAVPARADTASDVKAQLPVATVLDGTWSLATQIETTLIDRTWTKPQLRGLVGHYARRLLYGPVYAMLTLDGLVAAAVFGGDLSWLADARFRSEWLVPVVAPGCADVGSDGGCGLGLGGLTFARIRHVRSSWWLEAGGGWYEQRRLDDPLRTVVDSTLAVTPLSALYEVKTRQDAPVALNGLAGPGVYFAMHNASVHPTDKGEAVYHVPWTELIPLDYGVGPSGHAELAVTFARHLRVDGDLTIAPLVLGAAVSHPNAAAAPLDQPRHGLPVYRRATAGIGWVDDAYLPVRPSLEAFAAELSERRVDRFGYGGVMIRFEVPLHPGRP